MRTQTIVYHNPYRKSIPAQTYDRTSGRMYDLVFPKFTSPTDIRFYRQAIMDVLAPRISSRQLDITLAALKAVEDELFPPDVLEI